MVHGESGLLPPSVDCVYNTLCFLNRVSLMNSNTLVKQVYDELNVLKMCGFENWCSKAYDLMQVNGLVFNSSQNEF